MWYSFSMPYCALSLLLGECTNPKVKSSVYTSTDSFFSSETVYSIEMSVGCDNNEVRVIFF